ncbi:ACP S-malonyltransferase [Clostridium felsineum]|uniref:ACP S-malonyltransferase n=1 Tax=Clostridium felsineum TaxID=36839 RepID=UPI00098C42D4|nr:ACP S-malonyltransferase [Clostridium felsineum]URZ00313.1 Malonyl CoA-acyl carrier protein transacylase [Clostridium felsineum]
MRNIVILFPGQGAQYVGMGEKLYKESLVAKRTFQKASEILGYDLAKLCFEGNIQELSKTENAQPAILTASVAAYKVLLEKLPLRAKFMAGHSLGEITALTCAGAIKFSDAVKIVQARGRFMQEAVAIGMGAMAAVGDIDKEIVEEECRKNYSDDSIVVVSNYNSPNQIVISGYSEAVDKVGKILKDKGAVVTPLKVSAPFHSPLMKKASEKFKEELKKYSFIKPECTVISNLTALPYAGEATIINTLATQIIRPVQWEASMEYIENHGGEVSIDIGPGKVVKNLMIKNSNDIVSLSFENDDFETLKEEVEIDDNLNTFKHTIITKSIAIAVCTRNRNWDNEEYNKLVIEPYKKMQIIQDIIEKENRTPTVEEMQEALDIMISIFNGKKVPIQEQKERFREIFEETNTKELFPDFKLV